jgi:hypothetical protein
MKTFFHAISAGCLLILPLVQAQTDDESPAVSEEEATQTTGYTPNQYEVDRYEHIWQRSPFVIETKIVSESAGLAERFALTGIAVINGTPMVSLLDRSTNARMMVAPNLPSQGVEVITVDQQPNPRNSSVTIKLGAEQASLRFEVASLNRVQEGAPPIPGQNGASAAQRPIPIVQQINAPVPQVTQPGMQGQPPSPPATRVIRRTLIKTRE